MIRIVYLGIKHFFLAAAFSGLVGCFVPSSTPDSKHSVNAVSSETEVPPSILFRQLLIVTTADWDEYHGEMSRFVYNDEKWIKNGPNISVHIGKNGLAWGIGVKDFRNHPGPKKVEGDGKSPAGIFALGTSFGYASAEGKSPFSVPYVQIDENLQCIEDTESSYYNRIVNGSSTTSDWESTDHMLRKDDLYEWGMFVEHNANQPEPGGGSCIFLHVWRPTGKGTAGCTAMEKTKMLDLLNWVDESLNPGIVQVPKGEYKTLKNKYSFSLPDL